jgi:hypothetical protein
MMMMMMIIIIIAIVIIIIIIQLLFINVLNYESGEGLGAPGWEPEDK